MLRMTWIDLAFLHWPVPQSMVRALLPSELELDTYHDTAWLGVTPFRMTNVRPMMLPPIPTARDFLELNVRTYVRHGDRAGVFFFSLDAASWLAVETARAMTGLPYYHAKMSKRSAGNEIHYSSRRAMPGAPPAELRARYWPTGDVFASNPDSLEYFLTERYSLFVKHLKRLVRIDIEHIRWPLQPADAVIELNTMPPAGIELPDQKPHALFSRQLEVVAQFPVPAD
jgi:uncharacterized protein YqjF (DUF2071 family)